MSMKKADGRLLRISLLLTLFTISISSLSAATEVFFAQALRGSAASGTSCILIWNPTDTAASVTIRFTNQAGTVDETQIFSVAAQATEKRTLGGTGVALTVGSVKVTSTADGILATLLFSISGLPEVGVLSVLGNSWWSGVGQVDDDVNTGLAVRATGGPAVCTLTTYNANGSLAGSAPVNLGADDQTAMFLDEMIDNLPTPYRGCFSLHCEGNVAAVALRQRRSDGFFTVHPVNGEVPPVKGRPWKLPHYANRGKTTSSGGELASARSCFSTVRTALGKLRITGLLAQFDVARSFPQFPRPLLLQPTILTSERGTRFGIRKAPNHVPTSPFTG